MNGGDYREAGDYLDVIRDAFLMGKDESYRELDEVMGHSSAVNNERRWGAGGRGHFGDPREGDYKGGPVIWEPEEKSGRELEAGA